MKLTIVLELLGAMSLLIYGMKVMSEALQKMTGPQLRSALGAMTANRFSGVASGAVVTMAVQSSTATTVMTVSFVSAGLLTLSQAISVIMGANIGTTLTAWIMSAGFSFKISDLVWPAFFVGIVLIYTRRARYAGDFLYGLAFMILSLAVLKSAGTAMDLAHNKSVVDFFASFDPTSFLTIIVFLLVGSALTFLVHSSAAVMAITMILCSSGVLPIYQGIALVLGENIGTTLTANIAAMAGNTQSRRAAMAHLIFNVFGVIWVLFVFRFFVDFACSLVGLDPNSKTQDPTLLSFALAAFHTLFNLVNTAILIWFVPQLEKLVCLILPNRAEKEQDEEFKLRFMPSGVMKAPEVMIGQAAIEIAIFGQRVEKMFALVRRLEAERDRATIEEGLERMRKFEDYCDRTEDAVGEYLSQVSTGHLSDNSKLEVRRMLAQLSDVERIGDCCYNLASGINTRMRNGDVLNERQHQILEQAMGICERALSQMQLAVSNDPQIQIDTWQIITCRNEMFRLTDEVRRLNGEEIQAGRTTYASASVLRDCLGQLRNICLCAFSTVEARTRTRLAHEDDLANTAPNH